MSDRITFRGRGRHRETGPDGGVSYVEPRVQFVPGYMTGEPDPGGDAVECGDGTAFPMLVTLKQLCEIYYRVKDAWFISGQWTVPYSGTLYASTQSQAPERRYDVAGGSSGVNGYVTRGLVKRSVEDGSYDSGTGTQFYDVANELEQWSKKFPRTPAPNGYNQHAFDFDAHCISGGSYATSSPYWFNSSYMEVSRGQVACGNRVAVVKADEADGLFAPTNKFYLEIEFSGYWDDGGGGLYWSLGTNKDIWGGHGGALTEVCKYKIRLAPNDGSNDVECPIYHPDYGYSYAGEDFIHEAKEWWPYKTKSGEPAWDSVTGVAINGGPLW